MSIISIKLGKVLWRARMPNFIFFLTYNDITVKNALEIFEDVKNTKIEYVGFKDVGISIEGARDLVKRIKASGKITVMEVVSENEEAALESAREALEIDVDYLIGGSYVTSTLEVLKGKRVKYFPDIGKPYRPAPDLPLVIAGSIEEIVNQAKELEGVGVDGIDFAPFRYRGDVDRLISSVIGSVKIPTIIAGSIDNLAKVKRIVEWGVWGLTIGTAIFDKRFVPSGSISDQINLVMDFIEKS